MINLHELKDAQWIDPKIEDFSSSDFDPDYYMSEDYQLYESYIGAGPVTSEEESFDTSADYVQKTKDKFNVTIPEYELIDRVDAKADVMVNSIAI